MRISKKWLNDYIPVKDLSDKEIDDLLSLSGTEIEETLYPWEGLKGAVQGIVAETRPHPSLARLIVCSIQLPDKTKQLVTADKTVKSGDRVLLAPPGTVLYNGKRIEAQDFAGIVSEGMLCSLEELGLENKSEYVYRITENWPEGFLEDSVFEASITSNRPDELGLLGIARELTAITKGQRPITMPATDYQTTPEEHDRQFRIAIENPEDCYRYCGLIVRDVRPIESPLWLKRALVAGGLRPISFIVDVTNFVMLETGHPVHAFDLAQLKDFSIRVRKAKEGERFVLLDGQTITTQGFECMITDGVNPLALGGIMGGERSGVSERTRDVLLEVATFNPVLIRKTRKWHNLNTDASYRFERGVDPNNNRFVIDRLAHLIQKYAEGRVTTEIIDTYPHRIENRTVLLRRTRVEKVLGATYPSKAIVDNLENLGISVSETGETGVFRCSIPTGRPDLEREIDLIEEIGRIQGYEQVPTILPVVRATDRGRTAYQTFRNEIHRLALALGFNEIKPLSFADPSDFEPFGITEDHLWRSGAVSLVKPLSRDLSLLRPTLSFGLIKTLAFNFSRQCPDLKVFEIGKVFQRSEAFNEKEVFGFAQMGAENPEDYTDKRRSGFYGFKGNVEEIIHHLTASSEGLTFSSPREGDLYGAYLYPTHSAVISFNSQRIGIIGLVKKNVLSHYDIKSDVYLGEIDLNLLFSLLKGSNREWKSVQNLNYPSSRKDFSVLVPRGKEMGHVISELKRIEYVESVKITDIYKGKNIPEGFVSVTISLVLRSTESTITETQMNGVLEKVRAFLVEEKLEIREL
ncbi:MAG: phenylalanine--tRNA ligase subunit beta [Thermotogae bacterium]|nr:phenylalanine--tRNA ligase subunit beta [Thermotogota bacterium]HNR63514.1 phenylalanine--tRNA ligase subunit beta [Thermotogota bacterium]